MTRRKPSVNPYEEDPREVVAVIPPGCSLEQVQELVNQLRVCCPGKTLHIANQTDGGFGVFYYRDSQYELNEETGRYEEPNVIAEETDPNITIEVGDDDGSLFQYPSTESEQLIAGFAANLKTVLDAYEAANYVTSTIVTPDSNEKYAVTLQRLGAGCLTPSEKIAKLEDALRRIHHATGGHCPACPGEDSGQQPDCPHRDRYCGACGETWPCELAVETEVA